MTDDAPDQLWLELPPISASAPRRLLVFLHGAGSSPETFAPVAVAWQLKFPGATAVLMQGLRRFRGGSDWFDAGARDARGAMRAGDAASAVGARIAELQRTLGVDASRTVVVGLGQGGTLALELARARPAPAAIVVAYAGRLARPIRDDDRIGPTVHLIHGEFDSVVPAVHSARAWRGLSAVGADVTLDIVEDESHSIGQEMVNLGTARVMQTLFRGRRPPGRATLH
ncbi:MAG TPA: dienelactone hydrolase family protein [Burkholderiaceae bacterium]|nr:dienelactone hydrolase family protein [Burkholderiaceae bacterium]